MRIIKPSFEILEQEDLYKHMELCGRVCYKSEDKITDNSSKRFVDNLRKSDHLSVLEHGTVYLKFSLGENPEAVTSSTNMLEEYQENPYSYVRISKEGSLYYANVTTNYRVLIENFLLEHLKYAVTPTEFHNKRVTVKFICDRGVSHEFVRHRAFSFSQESTRYCNYSKDKFGEEVTFITPNWGNLDDYEYANLYQWDVRGELKAEEVWSQAMSQSEQHYLRLLKKGWTPQQARSVLPNSLKTELIMTGFISDWEHFFKLRCAENAHPQARELAIPLKEEFIKRRYINE